MLPKISGYGLSSESKFYIACPHCSAVNEVQVSRFVVAVSRSKPFVCVACEEKFAVIVAPLKSGNLTPDAADLPYVDGLRASKMWMDELADDEPKPSASR